MKSAHLFLGYFKRGDDLSAMLDEAEGDVLKALEMHAQLVEDVARSLRGIRAAILTQDVSEHVSIDANGHGIWVSGPDKFIDSLLSSGVVDYYEHEEEEEDDDDDILPINGA